MICWRVSLVSFVLGSKDVKLYSNIKTIFLSKHDSYYCIVIFLKYVSFLLCLMKPLYNNTAEILSFVASIYEKLGEINAGEANKDNF